MSALPRTVSRREMLVLALTAGAATALPGLATAAAVSAGDAATDQQFNTLLADFAEEILRLSPTSATSLGLDTGARSALKSQLGDASPAGDALWAKQVESMLARLDALDRSKLSAAAQIRYDTVRHSAGAGVEGIKFPFGGAASGFYGGTSPFPISQQDGALLNTPEFLDSQHSIKNAADAEAYLSRVAALARVLDQETARVQEQAAKGFAPPAFIAKTALTQLREFRATKVSKQKLVTSIATRTKKLGIAGDWEGRATKLVKDKIYPALDRQIAAFAKATANATDVAGVHRLPDGEAYYQWALKLSTSTNFTAAEIHAIGLEQNQQLQAKIDTILRSQGLSEGTVGERIAALAKDPKMFFPDDDKGRAQLIEFCNARIAAVRAVLPKMSHLKLKAPVLVKRVPVDIEAGAALGYMNFASLDGSRPSIYYVNLKSTKLWPKYELASLSAHEGLPGHSWQGAYIAEHNKDIPLIASLAGFNAFIEGWALYAEQLCDEFGLYEGDPFGKIGYLQGQQFRACRLVVDTGLHAMKWTRQQAIDFLVENTGRGVAAMTSEIDRYCMAPGQACGYKMGHNEMLRQRERAKVELGAKFDLAGFNDAIVKSTGVPLTVLPTVIDRFISESRT